MPEKRTTYHPRAGPVFQQSHRLEHPAAGLPGIGQVAELPRLLRLIAARHAAIVNVADLAAAAQLPRVSVQRYLDVLEAIFLSVRLPVPSWPGGSPCDRRAWRQNVRYDTAG